MSNVEILAGDVRDRLADLADHSVHMIVTSPPYWGLRDYGVPGQIGNEDTVSEYIAVLVAVFADCWRVLRDDGTLWLNVGDSYASAWSVSRRNVIGAGSLENGKRAARPNRLVDGLKEKDLIGVPWRLALALHAAGWYLRSEVTWAKTSYMPDPARDRPDSATESIFIFSKGRRYFWDRVAADLACGGRMSNFWLLGPDPYAEAHYATFPREIPKRAILAGTSAAGVCPDCGAPWRRVVDRAVVLQPDVVSSAALSRGAGKGLDPSSGWGNAPRALVDRSTLGWLPSCKCYGLPVPDGLFDEIDLPADCEGPIFCDACGGTGFAPDLPLVADLMPADPCLACGGIGQRGGDPAWVAWRAAVDAQAAAQADLLALVDLSAHRVPAVVLDPFLGSGTAAAVALALGRRAKGIELSPAYVKLAYKRIGAVTPALLGL